MSIRSASHAGSWYADSSSRLEAELDKWLADVPSELPGIGKIPVPGARAIIAPHAGYMFSGPCAAWAYKCLDLSKAKRVFILHPSHHVSLSTLALPTVKGYLTPLSPFPLGLDLELISHLSKQSIPSSNPARPLKFSTMSLATDEAEHSAEMQLPYLHRLFQTLGAGQPESSHPPLVPIMVGSTSAATEAAFGKLLAPYVADPENAFIISSDFCHWGSRFGYTYYVADAPSPAVSDLSLPNGVHGSEKASEELHKDPSLSKGRNLGANEHPAKPTIHESIAAVDRACMCAIATGESEEFQTTVEQTGNTVCGRHPIGVFMSAVEEVERARREKGESDAENDEAKGRFKFVRSERSGNVVSARDSSVSYVSAFAVL